MTHASETVAINSTLDFGACFSCRCTTSSVVDCLRKQSTTLEVVHRHEKLALEYDVEFGPMAPISGAGLLSVCHRPYDDIICFYSVLSCALYFTSTSLAPI